MRELQCQPKGEPFGVAARAVSQVVEEVGGTARYHGRLQGAGIGSAAAVEVDFKPSPLKHPTVPFGNHPGHWPVPMRVLKLRGGSIAALPTIGIIRRDALCNLPFGNDP